MIHHVVLVRVRPEVTDAEIGSVFAELHALQGDLAGLRSVASGRSQSPEHIERGYLHGLVIQFDDWDALQRYQDDPRHRAAGAKLRAAIQGVADGLLVFDLAS